MILFAGDGQFEKQGAYYSKVFDSTIEACQWHRLDAGYSACREIYAQPVVPQRRTKSLNWTETRRNLAWQPLFNTPHNSGAVNDALFANAAGRYLQLKFHFSGDGFHTHKVRQARALFPAALLSALLAGDLSRR